MVRSVFHFLTNLLVFSSGLHLRGHRDSVRDEPNPVYSFLEHQSGGDDAGAGSDAYQNLKPLELPIHYPGKPDVQPDGTEGNGLYYAGNYQPAGPWDPNTAQNSYDNDPYWRGKSPYWDYFKKVWGNAPFIDGNFRVWLQGGFRTFHMQRHPQMHQHTLGLPAWMHYYDPHYDPLLDTPYLSEYAIFGPGSEAGQSPKVNLPDNAAGSEGIHRDCSDGSWPNALGYKRPCFVSESQQKSWWHQKGVHNWNQRSNGYKDRQHYAQRARGSVYYLTKEANQPFIRRSNSDRAVQGSESTDVQPNWVGLDSSWGNAKEEGTEHSVKKVASNMFPPPPGEPPSVPPSPFGPGHAAPGQARLWYNGMVPYPKQNKLTSKNALTSPGD